MAGSFAVRFAVAASRWGPLVWGLDPSGALLETWGFGDCACLLVVTRSSNPEGRAIQAARGDCGRSVEEALLRDIGALNATLAPGGIGPIGAVVGPAHLEPSLDLPAARALFLAPGVGAQGATCADVARTFAACPDRVMPSASRSLLSAGPDASALRDTAATLASELQTALASVSGGASQKG